MDAQIRSKIENNQELMRVIDSPEWAADSKGELYRKAMNILLAIPVDEAIATEWLHEDDE